MIISPPRSRDCTRRYDKRLDADDVDRAWFAMFKSLELHIISNARDTRDSTLKETIPMKLAAKPCVAVS